MSTMISSKIDYLTLTKTGDNFGVTEVDNHLEAVKIARDVMRELAADSYGLEVLRAEAFYPWVFVHKNTGAEVAISRNIERQGVRVTFGGKSINSIEWANGFVRHAVKHGWRFTRIDFALDIVGEAVEWREFRSICEDWCAAKGLKYQPVVPRRGNTIYLGARTSNNMARFYDKGAQQRVDYPWTRLEIEVKGDTANAAAHADGSIWEVMLGHFIAWTTGLNHWTLDELRHYHTTSPELMRPAKLVKTNREVWFHSVVSKSLLSWAKLEPEQARRWVENMSSMLDILDGND